MISVRRAPFGGRPAETSLRVYNLAIMALRIKFLATCLAIYLAGIATPYVANYSLAMLAGTSVGKAECSRKTSPDGILDAVVIQYNPGAFSSYLYSLYLVPKGTTVNTNVGDPPIVQTAEGDTLIAAWTKPHFLSINYGNSHVKFFGNLWYSKRLPNYYVELIPEENGRHYLQENGTLR